MESFEWPLLPAQIAGMTKSRNFGHLGLVGVVYSEHLDSQIPESRQMGLGHADEMEMFDLEVDGMT